MPLEFKLCHSSQGTPEEEEEVEVASLSVCPAPLRTEGLRRQDDPWERGLTEVCPGWWRSVRSLCSVGPRERQGSLEGLVKDRAQ